MKILAVDTATSVASVAIFDNEILLGEYVLNNKKTHSVNLMPMIKELFEKVGFGPKEMDVLAVCEGPGSFTGIRIGVSAAKTMAFILKKPIIGVNTLDLLAEATSYHDGIICPILDARNRQVYSAFYKSDCKEIKRISEYEGKDIGEVIEEAKKNDRKIIFTGDASLLYADEIEKNIENSIFAKGSTILPKASNMCSIAMKKIRNNEYEDPYKFEPFYLRKSQAEQAYDKKFQ